MQTQKDRVTQMICPASVCARTPLFLNLVCWLQAKPTLDQDDPDTLEDSLAVSSERNKLPSEIVADGRTYSMILDVRAPDLPSVLELGTQIRVRA